MNSPPLPSIHAALEHHRAGRLPQAEAIYRQILQGSPNHPEALHFLGLIAQHRGEHETAAELIGKAVSISPAPSMQYNYGNVLQALGRLAEASESYRKALSLKPDYAEAHINLGNALKAQGDLKQAIQHYRAGLALKPQFAEAHNNLGLALLQQGLPDAAIASFQQALALKPDYAEALFHLGTAFKERGQLDAGIAAFRQTAALKPEHANAHLHLGFALIEQSRMGEAFLAFQRAFRLKESAEAKGGMFQCMRHVSFPHEIAGVRPLVMRAITEPWGRPDELALVSARLIKAVPSIRECLDRAVRAWPERLTGDELFGEDGLAAVTDDALLLCLLENIPIADTELEWFLSMTRHALLNQDDAPALDARELAFRCALAQQCFLNEYVFSLTAAESGQAQALQRRLAEALAADAEIAPAHLAALAAYFPLHTLPGAEKLLARSWSDSMTRLLRQQIEQPGEEARCRVSMPAITAIDDAVSVMVRQQYEANPYPRWVKAMPCTRAVAVDEFLRVQFPSAQFLPLGKDTGVDILIAGCGTGRQSIEAAQLFRGARLLAIDLSLSSLCYAKRKTHELGLDNIEYAQADIMQIGTLERRFDVIESTGVLHHLGDPLAGWRNLLALLRPNGFMRLAFYSEHARQSVVAGRDFIARHGYASDAEGIRRCRQDILALDDGDPMKQLTWFRDFFSLSECRDLIFHVQEHRYTLPQLKVHLAALELEFVGFALDANVVRRYTERFPDDPARINLDHWNEFELANPNTFGNMYQFWVQKRA